MNFLNDITCRTIIVCPETVKIKILNKINNYNKLFNIKFYTLDEIKKSFYFDYDDSAILYLMNKYAFNYETSKKFIDNLYFVEEREYEADKLNFLVKLKRELIDNKLLTINSLLLKNNKDIPMIVFGYDYIDKFNMKILSNFNYKIIDKEINNKNINVYKFKNMEDEILFVINEIIKLLNNNININKIYLLNLDANYNIEIKRLFSMFNIPVDIDISSSILTTLNGKEIFDYFLTTKSFDDTLNYIKALNIDSKYKEKIYNTYLNIFNKYIDCDYPFEILKEAILYDLKNTVIINKNLKNKVNIATLQNSFFDDDEYVFLLGFNQGSVPKVVKDEDYINDDLKEILGLNKTSEINKLERNATLKNINSIKNIYISYKESYLDTEYYKSNLLDETNFTICENIKLSTSNSKTYSIIKLAGMLDDLIKYDSKDEELPVYFNSFNIKYLNYDNKYKVINKEDFYKLLNNKLILSYSTIDTFFKCQFRYYIDNVLKLNKFEESFEIYIGKLFHQVLSKVYDVDFNIDKEYYLFLSGKSFTDKELFFLDKLKKELIIICNNLKEFYKDTELKDVMLEKDIAVNKSSDIEVIFKGVIDKIMYKRYPDKTLLSIIDYKTGNASIDLFDSAYGIGMQLIIYLYLISKSDLFENYYCVGFYLQKILNTEVTIDQNKTYIDKKNDNLKLLGYSIDEVDLLELFDITYEDSKYIKSMKYSNNKFAYYSKVLSYEKMNNICSFVDKKIDEARDKILNMDFSINPKWFDTDKEPVGCKFCKYKDLCFIKKDDFVRLKKYNDLSFVEEGEKVELDK